MRTFRRSGHAGYDRALLLTISLVLACEIHPFENVEPPTLSHLQVGPGLTPTSSWTGDSIKLLYVDRLGSELGSEPAMLWYLESRSGMGSPITYGIVPAGATEHIHVEAPLSPGVTYRVTLIATAFLTEGAKVERDFTP